MAGLYEDEIVGAQNRAETARRLREQASISGVPQGQMIGNFYVAPHWSQHLANVLRQTTYGLAENKASEEAKDLQRQKARDMADLLRQGDFSIPESIIKQASIPAQEPSFGAKVSEFFGGDEAKGTPAQIYQPKAPSRTAPISKEQTLMSLAQLDPETAKTMLELEMSKQRAEERKAEKEADRQFRADMYASTHGVRPGEFGGVVGGRIIGPNGQVQTLPRVGTGGGSTGAGGGSASGAAMSPNLWGRKPKSGEIKTGTDNNGNPALVDIVTGKIVPMSELGGFGKPKAAGEEKPLTEAQANAQLYSERMKSAEKNLEDVGSDYSPAAVNAAKAVENIPAVGWAANAMLSEKNQRVGQAQRDFVNAVLRKESGAAISPSEFANAQRQYFPQPGDTPEVMAQKQQNRALAQQQIAAAVPKKQQPQGGSSVDDLLKKYGGQ